MSLLTRTTEGFSSTEYWERFFKKRGETAFDWYGDNNKLCGMLLKYIKPRDKILVVGCGNSELSEHLYDVGYRHLTNIDISETVVNHLTFQKVDATQTPNEDRSYQATLDKGTLDAMASQEEGVLAGRILAEPPLRRRAEGKPSAPPPVPSQTPGGTLAVDKGLVCCAHHRVMVAGLAILGVGSNHNKDVLVSVLLVGLGGGGLELDPAVLNLKVA
ncbi:eEF1A lysine and N-terminal methyltransferase-like isoform X2 [Oncorhynchus nerka]|uniref:eEF1A lysine and N-terminal methyltransferase-like isoform X2 n=1 Tax=Oncorhynchus nerka TaxID=8023 RepID=UPI0031B7FAF0